MNSADILEKISERLGSSATVKTVFGEPIHVGTKTVVPVAKVAYGFGGGFGTGKVAKLTGEAGEGGGGGGGVPAYPAGALEITEAQTRFVPYVDTRLMAVAFAAGALAAAFVLRRR
jgi:uncharacterized spore protein YtfJ